MADKTTATVILEAILRDEDARKELLKLQKSTEGVGKAGKKVGGDSKSWLSKMKAGWIAIAAVVAGTARALVRFGKETVKAASDFQEANSMFLTVFAGLEKEAMKMRDELVNSYAMSRREASLFLGSVQDLLVPLGMNSAAAAKMSGEVVKLSADLGSFKNMRTEDVMRDIQSAMVGNFETVRKYGSMVSAATIKQEAMNQGLLNAKGEVGALTRAQLVYEAVLNSNVKAQGDMARTYDNWANAMKRVRAFGEDVKVLIGTELMKAFQPAVKAMMAFIGTGDGLRKVRKGITFIIRGFSILGTSISGVYSLLRDLFEFWKLLHKGIWRGAVALGRTLRAVFTLNFSEIGAIWKEEMGKIADASVAKFKERFAIHKKNFQDIQDDITAIQEAGEEERAEIADLSADERYEAEMAKFRNHIGLKKEEEIKFGEEMGEFRRAMIEANEKLETDAAKKFVDLTKQALRDVSKLVRARAKADEERVNQETDATIDALERRRDAGILTEEEFQEGKTAAEKKAAKEIATIKLKAFIAEKRAKIAEIIMATALGIMSAFKIPPPLGAIAAAAVAVLGGVQIAAVNAQEPPTIPAFAAGGIAGLHGPEVALLGERGPEIVIPAAQSAAMMSGDTNDNRSSMNFGEKSVMLQVSGGPEGARRLITSLQKLADSSGGGSFF